MKKVTTEKIKGSIYQDRNWFIKLIILLKLIFRIK